MQTFKVHDEVTLNVTSPEAFTLMCGAGRTCNTTRPVGTVRIACARDRFAVEYLFRGYQSLQLFAPVENDVEPHRPRRGVSPDQEKLLAVRRDVTLVKIGRIVGGQVQQLAALAQHEARRHPDVHTHQIITRAIEQFAAIERCIPKVGAVC